MRRAWLLDTGTVVVFQRGGALPLLARLATHDALVVVEEVYDELTGRLQTPRTADGRRLVEEAARFLDRYCVVEQILLGTDADAVRGALRAGRTTTRGDLGEDASIAWAAFQLDRCALVTNDVKAAGRALRELPRRVAMTHEVLTAVVAVAPECLEEVIALSAIAKAALAESRGWGAQEPLWWPRWVASIRSAAGAAIDG